MRTLIAGGTLYDGTGAPGRRCNVLLENERIAWVGQGDMPADRVIDAAGCAVTPGFIDTHRHFDLAARRDPEFGRIELAQGISTAICGNCGLAPIPAFAPHEAEILDYIAPCLGPAPEDGGMEQFADFLQALDRRPLHLGSFIGLGSLKAAVHGYGRGQLTRAEIERMQAYICQSLQEGAAGVSAGLMYQPECYGSRAEYAEILRVAAPFGRVLTCHIRGEGDSLEESVQEVIEIADRAGLPLNISHFKCTGLRNWGEGIYRAIDRIERARARGQDVTVDFYPYLGGSTTLLSLIPPVLMGDTVADTLKGLTAEKLSTALEQRYAGWDNMVESIGWERIVISGVTLAENRRYCNMDFCRAAQEAGFGEASAFAAQLLLQEEGRVAITVLSMCQADVDAVAALPYAMVISDALYGGGDSPHPRLYGAFPKILRDFVAERKLLGMETAIYKMTGMPARRLGLDDRGIIERGRLADVNVFKPEEFADKATFADPKQLAVGLRYAFVAGNGQIDNYGFEPAPTGSRIKF